MNTTVKTVDPVFRVVLVFPDHENRTMKIEFPRLTLAALLLSASATCGGVVSAQGFGNASDADYYSDWGAAEAAAVNNSPSVQTARHLDQGAGQPSDSIRRVSGTVFVGDDMGLSGSGVDYNYSGYDGYDGYDSYAVESYPEEAYYAPQQPAAGSGRRVASRMNRMRSAVQNADPNVWFTAELLLWFPQQRTFPPLGVGNAPGALPLLTAPGAVAQADSAGGDLVAGFRGDIGRYFGDGTFGVGGRVWVLGEDGDSGHFASDGNQSFGIPFFNTYLGQEDAVPVDFAPVGATGAAGFKSELDIVAAELYGRALIGQSRNHRLELIGGYSHFNIEDSLSMWGTGLVGSTPWQFNDRFETRNEFHGGQIGAEISLNRGRWTASSLTKVHLGNMDQRLNVNGTSVNLGAESDGLFARGGVLQGADRSEFAFAPEMNLKIGYQFRQHVNLHVGYSFIYWNNVLLAGDQVDRDLYVDRASAAPAPGDYFTPRDSGLFVQGIDLGATITF